MLLTQKKKKTVFRATQSPAPRTAPCEGSAPSGTGNTPAALLGAGLGVQGTAPQTCHASPRRLDTYYKEERQLKGVSSAASM